MRRASRTDATQQAIAAALRQMGYSVHCTHQVGFGFPDLVVGKLGATWLVECKSGTKAKFTLDQREFAAQWRGSPVVRLESTEEAIEWGKS